MNLREKVQKLLYTVLDEFSYHPLLAPYLNTSRENPLRQYVHQWEVIGKLALRKPMRALIGDEIGLGKTIIAIAAAMGVKISSASGFLLSIVFMVLTCATFTGLGLIIATKLADTEGFMSIMNLVIMPLFFLSGAFFPLEGMPAGIRHIMYVNPLTYGVDGLRGTLVGGAAFPLWLDFAVLLVLSIILAGLGAYFFSKMEAD